MLIAARPKHIASLFYAAQPDQRSFIMSLVCPLLELPVEVWTYMVLVAADRDLAGAFALVRVSVRDSFAKREWEGGGLRYPEQLAEQLAYLPSTNRGRRPTRSSGAQKQDKW